MSFVCRPLTLAMAALLSGPPAGWAQTPLVTSQSSPSPGGAPYITNTADGPAVSRDEMIRRLRQKVKYVFVIFNENHSFDNEFGTFPGANGLFSDGRAPRDAARTPGFTQTYQDANGQNVTVTPFRIGPEQNASFVDSVDHTHMGLARKLHVVDGMPAMDRFAAEEYDRFASRGGPPNQAMGTQFARLVMSYIDCDTIPLFWNYANRFVLFDNIFATEDSPSSPNAIAMIAGQAGETQWVKHGSDSLPVQVGDHTGKLQPPPFVTDAQPFDGSQYDTTQTDRKPAGGPKEHYGDSNISENMTFATLPLTMAGKSVEAAMRLDRAPEADLPDIAKDIPFIASKRGRPVTWRWYQEGYDHEPYDIGTAASHAGYVSHHEGPQYFGYLANNPAFRGNLRGMGDFFEDLKKGDIPAAGGVFYIRGGFTNIQGMRPPIQNSYFPGPLSVSDIDKINKTKSGDDDHPAYTDRMISETMAARVINAVASRPEIWSQSAIIITYDESDGFYDHVPPRILSYGPTGLPLARGIRVPLIVVSPYARSHVVSHAEGDHNAVIETIEAIFDLPPLASLPDEKAALLAGEGPKFNGPNGFVQHHLGPRDLNTPVTDDLLSAFDPARLAGERPRLPAGYATVPEAVLTALPHYGGEGCSAIGVVPVDRLPGAPTTRVPEHFNTLPATLPAYN
jgi:phospholipase C